VSGHADQYMHSTSTIFAMGLLGQWISAGVDLPDENGT
jgi:hypothetical protein